MALTEYNLTEQFSPICSWDFAPIGVANKFANFNPIQISPRTRTMAYVDEIRFTVEFPMDIRAALLTSITFGADTPLCKQDMPLWLLGVEFNRQLVINPLRSSDAEDGVTMYVYTQSWKFARPMLMAPEDTITISMRLDEALIPYIEANVASEFQNTTVYVNLVGRSLPSDFVMPKEVDYPFTTFFRSPLLPFGTTTNYETKLNQLHNPHQQELQIEKFQGRIFAAGQDSFTAGVIDANESALTVRIMDNMGRGIQRDFVPFAELYHSSDNCWWSRSTMPPKSFHVAKVKAELNNYPSGWPTGADTFDNTSLIDLAVCGYRTLKIS